MSRRATFDLSKWYLDCVDHRGHTFIGYSGTLRWKAIVLPYESLLLHKDGEETQTRFSLRRVRPPIVQGNVVRWESPALSLSSSWDAVETPVHATILDSEAGAVEWHCLQPRATARVQVAGAPAVCGLGYVEFLKMTLPPWQLPLNELRWGRFLSEAGSLVWIDWQGPYAKRVIFHNGTQTGADAITDEQIVLSEGAAVLHLDRGCVLREGTIGETALPVFPRLGKLFPARALRIRECKWRSRGVLRRPGASDAVGWAIHEVVQWP